MVFIPSVHCADSLQVSTIRRTLLIDCVRWKIYVGMVDSTTRLQINGSGTSTFVIHNHMLSLFCRFITPIFLHAGIIHFLLNMLAQMTVSAEVCISVGYKALILTVFSQVEKEMGSGGFLILYFAGGIFGYVAHSPLSF